MTQLSAPGVRVQLPEQWGRQYMYAYIIMHAKKVTHICKISPGELQCFSGGLLTTIYFAIVFYWREFLISIDVTKQNVSFELKVFKSSKIKWCSDIQCHVACDKSVLSVCIETTLLLEWGCGEKRGESHCNMLMYLAVSSPMEFIKHKHWARGKNDSVAQQCYPRFWCLKKKCRKM